MKCGLLRCSILFSELYTTHTHPHPHPNAHLMNLNAVDFALILIESLPRLVRSVSARIVTLITITEKRKSISIEKLIFIRWRWRWRSSSSSLSLLSFRIHFPRLQWQMKPTNRTNFIKKTFLYFCIAELMYRAMWVQDVHGFSFPWYTSLLVWVHALVHVFIRCSAS